MLPIKNFLLKDYAPIQITLYSIPCVNVFVRFFQSHHSLDNFKGSDYSEANIDRFETRRANFQKHMTGAIQIQIASLISSLVVGILFPTALPIVSHICAFSFALALSNFVTDKLSRAFGPRIYMPYGGPNGEDINIKGY